MLDKIAGKARRLRTRLLMRSALTGGYLYRVLSRNVADRFAHRAEGWDQMVAEHEHKWFDPLDAALNEIAPNLQPDRVIDLGGGTGRAGYHVAHLYPQAVVTVIDIAPAMLSFGKKREETDALPALNFVAGDCTALPLRDESTDLIFIMNAPFNPREMARVLRPNGVVVLAFTYGHYTPMYLDESTARRALARAGFVGIGSGQAGEGSWVAGILGDATLDQP